MAWLRRRRSDQVEHVGDQGALGSEIVNPQLEAWASIVDVSGVSDKVAADIDYFLHSKMGLYTGSAYLRHETALRLVSMVSSQVSPPPSDAITPMDVLATVLTLRERQRGGTSPTALPPEI
jgi:hypothetical protein